MRLRRLLAATLATTLLSPAAALAAASPAASAEATQIVGSSGGPWLVPSSYRTQPGAPVYGDSIPLSIDVKTSDGDQVFDGALIVERLLAGQSTWKTVASSTSAYLYDTIKAVGTATYRVRYAGNETYAPSETSRGLKVQRDLNATPVNKDGKLFIKGKVAPEYAGKKVVVQRRDGKKWTKFSVVRTTSKSAFTARAKAPAKRGAKVKHRVVVAAGGRFVTSTSPTYVATRY